MTLNSLKHIISVIVLILCGFNIYFYWSSNDTVYAWIVAFIGWLDIVTRKES